MRRDRVIVRRRGRAPRPLCAPMPVRGMLGAEAAVVAVAAAAAVVVAAATDTTTTVGKRVPAHHLSSRYSNLSVVPMSMPEGLLGDLEVFGCNKTSFLSYL